MRKSWRWFFFDGGGDGGVGWKICCVEVEQKSWTLIKSHVNFHKSSVGHINWVTLWHICLYFPGMRWRWFFGRRRWGWGSRVRAEPNWLLCQGPSMAAAAAAGGDPTERKERVHQNVCLEREPYFAKKRWLEGSQKRCESLSVFLCLSKTSKN